MNLPHRAISVYRYLADRANKDGICWPSIPTISKDLKKRGMKFVGSTVIYSYLQAIGIINGHLKGCFKYKKHD